MEYEQEGPDRADYGSQTLKRLLAALKVSIGWGFSVDALESIRRFYLRYQHVLSDGPEKDNSATASRILRNLSISETASRILASPSPRTTFSLLQLAERFPLGWSQYVTLLSVAGPDARRFYGIEAQGSG